MIHEIINTLLFVIMIALQIVKPSLLNTSLWNDDKKQAKLIPGLNIPVNVFTILLALIFLLGFIGMFTDGMTGEFYDVSQHRDCTSCTSNGGCWNALFGTCTKKTKIKNPIDNKEYETCGLSTSEYSKC
jgi:hypothetical protein